ncbi:hypothetical protein CLOLEP_03597 [[Clostridium] leptum DSM 753]|uniref:Uncharacterized protein n=1 Tax=[Clostridium] leptum DSM 753 TaxID=428125 RepID=A7VYB9_9FIRM|nr:hypothetical protein CLOLEP_03597 [[Clostridium] leptum DSM 753]
MGCEGFILPAVQPAAPPSCRAVVLRRGERGALTRTKGLFSSLNLL